LLHYAPAEAPVYLIDPSDDVKNVIRNVTHIKAGASAGMKELVKRLGEI
jgi:hypothetical protein